MSSTPKINKIEINNAYNIKDNNRIKHTQYSYENVDNGTIENSETFFPYNETNNYDLFVSSNYFLADSFDKSWAAHSGCKLCSPTNVYSSDSGSGNGSRYGQILSVVGNEMIYGINYTSCEYITNVSNPPIRKIKRAILIHTMQGFNNPYQNTFGFQWNYSNDSLNPITDSDLSNVSDIKNLPSKTIHFASRYEDSDPQYYFICQPFSGNEFFQEYISPYWRNNYTWGYLFPYDTSEASSSTQGELFTYSIPDYNVVAPQNLNLGENFPFYATNYKLETTRYGYFTNNYRIQNVKRKKVGSISYLCSDLSSYIPYNSGSLGKSDTIKFDARLLPTKSYDISNGRPTYLYYTGTGAQYGYDVCKFLSAYSKFKQSGLTIRPAILDHNILITQTGECFLPTVDVNNVDELVPYFNEQGTQQGLYAPIDVDKCEKIIEIIKDIVSTAINEVFITTIDIAAENEGLPNRYEVTNHPEFTTKKDLSTFRNETEGSLQRYI